MRPHLTRLAAGMLATLLLPLPHATAQESPELYQPCTNTFEGTVVPVGTSPTFDLETPTHGAALFVAGPDRRPLGSYVIDLAGLEVGQKQTVTFTLAWDSLTGMADYDMFIYDQGSFTSWSTISEVARFTATHCQAFSGLHWYDNFGSPTDTLTLNVDVSLPHATAQQSPELYQPCTNALEGTVVPVGTSPTFDVETPLLPYSGDTVGRKPDATGSKRPLGNYVGDKRSLGSYVIDLAGLEVGQERTVTFTLAWGSQTGMADYDMSINRREFTGYDTSSEVARFTASHCQVFSGQHWLYNFGSRNDALTLNVDVPA